ncbi:MAG TPA: L-serine ammonia-lyase, iron-sulfur-dependent, subunit alpha [Eubacteriales bacterium]|nr:L-serine ammonia-lyase, iron-sulfur-dependent, subunit alpha [Clostridia bacterium]HRV72530.1 L-serine ammonia-lyase, iron-sulfur-dependent, subunit alpha [Eubacteriales bacterium]
MLRDTFDNGKNLVAFCRDKGITLGEAMLMREIEQSERDREDVLNEMYGNLEVMRDSVRRGLMEKVESVSKLSGGEAMRLFKYAQRDSFSGKSACRAVAAAMAVVEVNSAMGRIVAAPTAGASGILPGVLIECGTAKGWSDEKLVMGLFTAGAIGLLFAKNATISGAEGGCQAETGVAAAMTAGALVEQSGGDPEMALDAAAMAIKNIMGLICDPVAGLVECPCIKRNALGAANAMICADMTLCGITSLIPFDEVVAAMYAVGRDMRPEYRETARGGLAATPTGKKVAELMKNRG